MSPIAVQPTGARRRQPRRTPRWRPSCATSAAAIKQGETLLPPLREAAQAFDIKAVQADAAASRAGLPPSQPGWIATHRRACYADVTDAYA